jgi:hypothetical protein
MNTSRGSSAAALTHRLIAHVRQGTHAIGHASAWQASPQEYCTAYGLQQRINIIVIIILASISPSSKTHQRRAGQLPRRMRHVTSYAHQ